MLKSRVIDLMVCYIFFSQSACICQETIHKGGDNDDVSLFPAFVSKYLAQTAKEILAFGEKLP